MHYAPWGCRLPGHHLIRRPSGGLARMTGGASIQHLVFVCHRGRDEFEGVRADKRFGDTLGSQSSACGRRHTGYQDFRPYDGYALPESRCAGR
jgi:hypothetical protein